MSGLPSQIPQQSVPLIIGAAKSPQYMDINWYLWAYNISKQVLGTAAGGGSTPASPYDVLDAANLIAQGADIPQAYRQIANLKALIGVNTVLPDPMPAAQPVQTVTPGASPLTYTALANGVLSVTGGAVSAVTLIRQGVSVATGITSSSSASLISGMTDEKGSGGTFGFATGVDFTPNVTMALTLTGTYANAADLWVAFDGVEQGADSYSLSGHTLTFTSAIPTGTNKVYVKGASASSISGANGGLVPLRRLDQVQITYTSAPTVVFLPG
jgi:hypothetical protein